jgi:hypothetical protein
VPQNIAGISVLSQAFIVLYTIEKNLCISSNVPLYQPSESKSFLSMQLLQLEAAIAATIQHWELAQAVQKQKNVHITYVSNRRPVSPIA